MKTIFCDIDGVLVEHTNDYSKQLQFPPLLEGTLEKMKEWVRKDYRIILTTGRREGNRAATIQMLELYGIPYDILIMGLPRGERVVINDLKQTIEDANVQMYHNVEAGNEDWVPEQTARAINVFRNEGIAEVFI